MLRTYLLIFSILISVSSCKSSKLGKSGFNGKWKGTGYQKDVTEESTWSIITEIDLKKEEFQISYPSLNCSGQWKLLKISKNKAVFKETIDNEKMCTNHGIIILTKVDKNHISFSYYRQNEHTVSSFSTLKRSE